MLNRLILFLIRKKLGVTKYEYFQFANQKTKNLYFFDEKNLIEENDEGEWLSGVALNWLLDPICKAIPCEDGIVMCDECIYCQKGKNFGVPFRYCSKENGLDGYLEMEAGCTRGSRRYYETDNITDTR